MFPMSLSLAPLCATCTRSFSVCCIVGGVRTATSLGGGALHLLCQCASQLQVGLFLQHCGVCLQEARQGEIAIGGTVEVSIMLQIWRRWGQCCYSMEWIYMAVEANCRH